MEPGGDGEELAPVLPRDQGLDLRGEAVVELADLVGVDGHSSAPFVSVER
jgi:hypothetical protein